MNKFFCDFVFINKKVIVEADGDYWHTRPNSKYSKNPPNQAQKNTLRLDKSKNGYITKVDNGSWTLLRFWESDIDKDVVKCVDQIEEVLRSKSVS